VDQIHEVRFWEEVRPLEQLAKPFALLVEKVEHAGSVRLVQQLLAAGATSSS
jgi:hypothetical protein